MKFYKICKKYGKETRARVQYDGKSVFVGTLEQLAEEPHTKHMDFECTQTGSDAVVLIIPKRMRGMYSRYFEKPRKNAKKEVA